MVILDKSKCFSDFNAMVMSKIKVGNKQNSFLNGEWAKHGRRSGKRYAARKRRSIGKSLIIFFLQEM